jgi:hypothetical protein
VQNSLEEVRSVYSQLNLGDFSLVEPELQAHLADVKNYRPNQYELPDEKRQLIATRWAGYIERYGY